MKKRVQIVGYSHKTGKSAKTGKEYDFAELNFVYPDDDTIGERCASGVIDWDEVSEYLDGYVPDKGLVADLVFHYQMGRVVIDAII